MIKNIRHILICHILIAATIVSPLFPYISLAEAQTLNTNTPSTSSVSGTNTVSVTNTVTGTNNVSKTNLISEAHNDFSNTNTIDIEIDLPQADKEIEIVGYDESSPLFSQRINKFLKSVSKSHYQFRMVKEEMAKALNAAGFIGTLYQAGRRSARVRGEVHNTAEEELAYIDKEFNDVKKEAQAIADDMIDKSSSTEDLNLKLFVLAHLYLTNPRARGAIQEIVEAFKNKINEKYFREIEKSKRPTDQMAQAAVWTAIAAVVLSLKKPAQGSKTMLTLTRESSMAYMKQVSQRLLRIRQAAAHGTEEVTHIGLKVVSPLESAAKPKLAEEVMTLDDLINELKAMGAQLPDAPAKMKSDAEKAAKAAVGFKSPFMRRLYSPDYFFGVSRHLTKSQIMKWMRARTTTENAYNLYFLTGVSGVVGGLNVAGHQVHNAFHTVDLNDQKIDLRELIDQDYNELSTLMLQCQIRALKEELKLVKEGENLWNEQRLDVLNSWLADSELVRRFSVESGVAQKRLSSMPVRYDKDLQAYVAKINYLNHEVQEIIPCHPPENYDSNAPAAPIEIGFEDAFLILKEIVDMSNKEVADKQKAQEEKEAAEQELYRQRATEENRRLNLEQMQKEGKNSAAGSLTNAPSATTASPAPAPVTGLMIVPSLNSIFNNLIPSNTPAPAPLIFRSAAPFLMPTNTDTNSAATNNPSAK